MKKTQIDSYDIYMRKQESADYCVIQLVGTYDVDTVEEEYKLLTDKVLKPSFHFVAVCIQNPNEQSSPWNLECENPDMHFGDGARDTLFFLQKTLIPYIKKEFANDKIKFILGGYSLLGLFALWAGYECNDFVGIGGVSPSVWFMGWKNYIIEKEMQAKFVYLSLGTKEKKTRNPYMKCIADNIVFQEACLKQSISEEACCLSWNPGNHFSDVTMRKVLGFEWLLRKLGEV